MGRRLNIPQPTVINTELAPFDENFELVADGQLEQWYYDNNEGTSASPYSPNRKVTALTLTPRVSVFDPDNNTTLTPTLNVPNWYVTEWVTNGSTSGYVESQITNVDDSPSADFVIVGKTLKVKKNVSYTRPIQIRCQTTYIDPRDVGLTYSVEATVTLSTNRDASVVFPSLDIACPPSISFNPLVDTTSQFTLTAIADKGGVNVTDSIYYVWKAVNESNNEVLANTMPWYVSGQGTKNLVVNALWGEEIKVVLTAKESAQAATAYPSRAYRTIMWVIPDVDVNVVSENGGAIRADMQEMTFDVTANVRHNILSDQTIASNLRFNWRLRKNNASVETDLGWGRKMTVPASDLRNVKGEGTKLASTIVYPIVYVVGAFEKVTHNNAVVTHNGEDVYTRNMYNDQLQIDV